MVWNIDKHFGNHVNYKRIRLKDLKPFFKAKTNQYKEKEIVGWITKTPFSLSALGSIKAIKLVLFW